MKVALIMAALFLSAVSLSAAGGASTPVGLWKTVDDKTGEPRGLVRVYEENGEIWGRIEATLKPEEAHEHCDKCTDERKGKPVIGMVIMRRLKRNGGEYTGGDILDPDTGAVYRCKLKMADDGRKLLVRGYLGISLFGRSQVWTRER
jgi:uncharacterized protein (DUF2147 family)